MRFLRSVVADKPPDEKSVKVLERNYIQNFMPQQQLVKNWKNGNK